MLYRKANKSDVPSIVEMGRGFWLQTSYSKAGLEYSDDRASVLAEMCIDTGVAIIAETDGYIHGMIICMVHNAMFSDDLLCSDIAFYVSLEGRRLGVGRKLLGMARDSAKEMGVKAISMISLQSVSPEKSQALFVSEGYHHAESTYLLVI